MFERELLEVLDGIGLRIGRRRHIPRVRRILTFDVFYMIRQRSMSYKLTHLQEAVIRNTQLSKDFRKSVLRMKEPLQDVLDKYIKTYPIHEGLFIRTPVSFNKEGFVLGTYNYGWSQTGLLVMQWDDYDVIYQTEFPVDRYKRLEKNGAYIYVSKYQERYTETRFDQDPLFRYTKSLEIREYHWSSRISSDMNMRCSVGGGCDSHEQLCTPRIHSHIHDRRCGDSRFKRE